MALGRSGGFGAPLLAALGLAAAAAADSPFIVTPLAPDLLMLSVDEGSYCTNSLVFTGSEGVLLVDTQGDAEAAALRAFVDSLGLGTPRYIISTHRHVEHIGGNAVFGPEPVIIAHRLLPEKLRGGTYVFNEYPPEAFPDITFTDSLQIVFNGETIRLVHIGGSHDDNEIMVHFTGHRIAHISSVVNGFNFPSVDKDGDALQFEAQARRLTTLLPRDVRLVSGHNGRPGGFAVLGTWDQLPAYADMMKATVEIVRAGLAAGRSAGDLQAAQALAAYEAYAGSYVSADAWIETVAEALADTHAARQDLGGPIFRAWKQDGAQAAVNLYGRLLREHPDDYDFGEAFLLSIGAKLHTRGLDEDAVTFLHGSITLYPESEYGYYCHYMLAKALAAIGRADEATVECRTSVRLNPDYGGASALLEELTGEKKGE